MKICFGILSNLCARVLTLGTQRLQNEKLNRYRYDKSSSCPKHSPFWDTIGHQS